MVTQGSLPQIQASDNENNSRSEVYSNQAGQTHIPTVTHTFVIKKLTPLGSNGSMTQVNGKITAYTAPT